MMATRIRPFRPSDASFVVSLATRFSGFRLPEWRSRSEIDEFFRKKLQAVPDRLGPEEAILIAEEESGEPVGFVHVLTEPDHFNGQKGALISDVAVTKSREGHGIGPRLLEAAEDWARETGCDLASLYVFEGNMGARRMYERHGFGPEVLLYVKRVRPT